MYYKYPRTYHLAWSESLQSDDKLILSMKNFIDKEVIVSIKMDGENASLYNDYYHARSLDSRHHVSRDWIKSFHSTIKHKIPENWRICGENLFAKHAIQYTDLESYFYGFAAYDHNNICLSWDETQLLFEDCGIISVPVVYRGKYNEYKIKSLWKQLLEQYSNNIEGYVVRIAESFHYDTHSENVAKFVRAKHVQPDAKHWMHSEIIPNKLKKEV